MDLLYCVRYILPLRHLDDDLVYTGGDQPVFITVPTLVCFLYGWEVRLRLFGQVRV